MRKLLFLLTLLCTLTTCADSPYSQQKALPFTCGSQNISQTYFDHSHINYLAPITENQGPLKKLVVFGGSFSDTGILNSKTLDAAIPTCTYWQKRASNGPIWSDYLAGAYNLEHRSYAVAGAQTNPDEGIKAPLNGLLSPFPNQINEWEKETADTQHENTLFVIWIGPNDYLLNAKKVQDRDGKIKIAEADQLIAKTIEGIQKGIFRLRNKGAQHIVVGNVAHLGDIVNNQKDEISKETYHYLETKHNQMLEELEGVKIFHAYERNEDVLKNLERYGFSDNERCYKGSLAGFSPFASKTFCDTPLRTRHWDDIHPNTRMHCLWTEQFIKDVGEEFGLKEKASIIDACLRMQTKSGEK